MSTASSASITTSPSVIKTFISKRAASDTTPPHLAITVTVYLPASSPSAATSKRVSVTVDECTLCSPFLISTAYEVAFSTPSHETVFVGVSATSLCGCAFLRSSVCSQVAA